VAAAANDAKMCQSMSDVAIRGLHLIRLRAQALLMSASGRRRRVTTMVMLASADLAHLKRRLEEREAQLRGEVAATNSRLEEDERFTRLAGEAGDLEDAALADLTIDLTQAELGRDLRELQEIQRALARIAAGSYGVCQRCGQLIDRSRLELNPVALYDVRCQELRERTGRASATPSL
jgi:DnaK suppressor protein